MTRAEMVRNLDDVLMDNLAPHEGCEMAEFHRRSNGLQAIRAELLQTCAGCKHDWTNGPEYEPYHQCRRTGCDTPADGSGFCHDWQAKS